MELINKIMPWFVTAAVLWTVGMVAYVTLLWPVTLFGLYLLAVISISGIGVIIGYFKIYALFERMDKRDAEWERKWDNWR